MKIKTFTTILKYTTAKYKNKKNDVVTVKNHTSNTESINTVANAGGKYSSLSAILQIFKIC